MAQMIITTIPSVEGRKITDYHGIAVGEEEAVALNANGFAKEVLQALPMEFAMEAQALVAISLEGSVG